MNWNKNVEMVGDKKSSLVLYEFGVPVIGWRFIP